MYQHSKQQHSSSSRCNRKHLVLSKQNLRHTWKTPRKNGRKWSNISVKKYHHMPTLGVRSDAVRLRTVSAWALS
jgi:hypothetical protein